MNAFLNLFTPKEASEVLRSSTGTVRGFIRSGALPVVRFNRRIFIRRQDLDKLILDSVTVKIGKRKEESPPKRVG